MKRIIIVLASAPGKNAQRFLRRTKVPVFSPAARSVKKVSLTGGKKAKERTRGTFFPGGVLLFLFRELADGAAFERPPLPRFLEKKGVSCNEREETSFADTALCIYTCRKKAPMRV